MEHTLGSWAEMIPAALHTGDAAPEIAYTPHPTTAYQKNALGL
jgi:hypothetical protein